MEATNRPNYEYRVGLFTVIALIILFWGWSWLKGFSLHPPQRFQVEFHDIAGLTMNAPVQVNGVRVGTVEKIELKGKGQVICSLRIPAENTVIPQGSNITIQTLGLVGAKYVEITLPKEQPGEPVPAPIEPDTLVVGQDPTRVELYVNHIAANISEFSDSLGELKARNGIAQAARESGAAMENIKNAAAKFNHSMDSLTAVTADLKQGAGSASGFFVQGKSTLQKISGMAEDWQNTSRKINHLVDQPNLSGDIKETAQLARQTAVKVQEAIHELNHTLNDKDVRQDMISMLNKLTSSTENINQSMQVVKQLAGDQQLRSDLKEAMSNAKSAMIKADKLLSNPNFIADARATMAQLRTAASQVSDMAQRINKILGKKHPILHMLFSSTASSTKTTKTIKSESSDSSAPQSESTEKHVVKTEYKNLDESNSPETDKAPVPGTDAENNSRE